MRPRALVLALAGSLAACGGATGAPDAAGADAATTPADQLTLIETSWSLPPHSETYLCARRTVDRELYIHAFEPVAPLGTHHTVLTLDDGRQPDGVTRCGATVAAPRMIFGAGVGSLPLEMPEGVAMRVVPGQQLLLNLHLYNTGDAPLVGTSGVRARTVAPEQVRAQAEAILAGTLELDIQPGRTVQTGRCTIPADVTIFAAGPHMHRLGVHQKLSVAGSGRVLYDRDYSFDQQTLDGMSVPLRAGEQLVIDCTYVNDTGGPIGWGESTDAEMCFSVIFRTPALGGFFLCTS